MRKVFVLGIDGGRLKSVENLTKKGKLPFFSQLLTNSIVSSLISTIPPITVPAWLCMFTGKNPGKIGFLDFTRPAFDYQFQLNEYKGKMLWDYLPFRTAVFNLPGIKPYKINGFMVNFNNSSYLKLPLLSPNLSDKEKMNLEFLKFEKEKKIILKFLKRDFRLIVYITSLIDHVSHFTKKEKDLYKAYERIDQFLEELLPLLAKRGYDLLIVSDHGIKKVKMRFNINTFLKEIGLLKEIKGLKKRKFSLLLTDLLLRFGCKHFLHNLRNKLCKSEFEKNIIEMIDFTSTKLFGLGVGGCHSFPLIYSNSKRFKSGKFSLSKGFLLKSLKQHQASKFIKNVWHKNELYFGKKIDWLPDFIICLEECCVVDYRMYPSILIKNEDFSHSMDGILLFHNNRTKFKKIKAKILDITPTLLELFNRKVKGLDGNSLHFP